jgi:hypothetical protein
VRTASRAYCSIYDTLVLTGAMAAVRSDDRETTPDFLSEAERAHSGSARTRT